MRDNKIKLELLVLNRNMSFKHSRRNPKPMASYTREEVALHNTEKDLWLIIQGKVYNFSNYAKSHPGGAEIILHCAGRDCT